MSKPYNVVAKEEDKIDELPSDDATEQHIEEEVPKKKAKRDDNKKAPVSK